MGICYYCEHDITNSDIFMQRRAELERDGNTIGHVHKHCFTLYKKYGNDYFIIEQYLENTMHFSKYELKQILAHLEDTENITPKEVGR